MLRFLNHLKFVNIKSNQLCIVIFRHVKDEEKQQFKYIVYFVRSIVNYFCIKT